MPAVVRSLAYASARAGGPKTLPDQKSGALPTLQRQTPHQKVPERLLGAKLSCRPRRHNLWPLSRRPANHERAAHFPHLLKNQVYPQLMKRFDVLVMNPPFGDATPTAAIRLENDYPAASRQSASRFERRLLLCIRHLAIIMRRRV
jgi:hypothetical protein